MSTLDDGQAVSDLATLGDNLQTARGELLYRTEKAREGALAALAEGESESAVAKALGVDRMTVRKWAGKR